MMELIKITQLLLLIAVISYIGYRCADCKDRAKFFWHPFFMTIMEYPEDFRVEPFQHLVINGIPRAAGKPIPQKWADKINIEVSYRGMATN